MLRLAGAIRNRLGTLRVVEVLRTLADDSAADEPLESPEILLIFRGDETDRIANRVRPSRPADAVNVVLGVHGEVVVHHVGDAVHVNAASGDIRRHQDAYGA